MRCSVVNCQFLACGRPSGGGRRRAQPEWAGMERKPNKYVLAAIAVVHVVVVTLTWRDIRSRPAGQVRGNKKFWLVASGLNTANAAV
jgi:hypothetical protein